MFSGWVFTTNGVRAAPVRYCESLLKDQSASYHAIIANSGNSNDCTGRQGEIDTKKMATEVARHLKLHSKEVLVCSTGRIGEPLPMSRITAGIFDAADDIKNEYDGAQAFQEAILTSDTCTKSCSAKIEASIGEITVGGVVKGAGMIEPNMATMLAFLTTDISATNSELQSILTDAVNKSFNRITIDGDMSTNDSVLIMANGNSGIELSEESKNFRMISLMPWTQFVPNLPENAFQMEKVTKFVKMRVIGAKTENDAEKVARCIANSLLVKTSWYGSDPNWRIIDAAGYAKVGMKFDEVDLDYNEVPALQKVSPSWATNPNGKKLSPPRNLPLPSTSIRENQQEKSGPTI